MSRPVARAATVSALTVACDARSISPSIIAPGTTAQFTAAATSTQSLTGTIVAFDVFNAAGTRVYHTDQQLVSFAANGSQTFQRSWAVPANQAPGTYTLKFGVFGSGWTSLNAYVTCGTFTVGTPVARTSTPASATTTSSPTQSTQRATPTATPSATTSAASPTATAAPLTTTPTTSLVASQIYYVDGKNGSDSYSGLCLAVAGSCGPFKHIYAAANAVASDANRNGGSAAGDHVEVVGYTDYVYHERPIPGGWHANGTAANPIVFEAYGFNQSRGNGYTMPIVSGGYDITGGWTKVSGYTNVYSNTVPMTDWSSHDWTSGSTRAYRLFVDNTKLPLRRPASCAGLQTMSGSCTLSYLDAQSDAYIMDDPSNASTGTLYVNLQNAPGVSSSAPITQGQALTSTNPNAYILSAEHTATFYFNGNGSTSSINDVHVQGFRDQYADSGIAFVGGASNSVAQYDDGSYSYDMGFEDGAKGLPTTSSNNTYQYNTCTENTLQCIKLDSYSVNGIVQYNVADDGGFIQSLAKCAGNGTSTSAHGCTIRDNQILNSARVAPYNAGTSNVAGIMVQDGAYDVHITGNIFRNDFVGVTTYESSPSTNPITNVEIMSNTFVNMTALAGGNGGGSGYALDLEDGTNGYVRAAYNTIANTLKPSTYTGYTSAGGGILLSTNTTNKWLDHDTFYEVPSYLINANSNAHATITNAMFTNNGYWSDSAAPNSSFKLWNLDSGATLTVDHANIYGNANTASTSATGASIAVTNGVAVDPQYLSTTMSDALFLTVTTTSPVYTSGSDGKPLGARWQ